MDFRARLIRLLVRNVGIPAGVYFLLWLGYSVIAPALVGHGVVTLNIDFYQH